MPYVESKTTIKGDGAKFMILSRIWLLTLILCMTW